jgi:hypothetical protein
VVINVQLGAASENGEEESFIYSTLAYANNSTLSIGGLGIRM